MRFILLSMMPWAGDICIVILRANHQKDNHFNLVSFTKESCPNLHNSSQAVADYAIAHILLLKSQAASPLIVIDFICIGFFGRSLLVST